MNAKTVPVEVAEYLDRLRSAARRLPRRERNELLEAITEHVMTGAEHATSSTEVRNMLEDLGEPDELVAAATPPGSTPRAGLHEIAAVALLLVGAFVVPGIGWLVGVVLLWSSPAWTRTQKWLGTLGLPGGLAAPFLYWMLPTRQVCSYRTERDPLGGTYQVGECNVEPVLAPWLPMLVLVGLVAVPLVVGVYLLRSARRDAEGSDPRAEARNRTVGLLVVAVAVALVAVPLLLMVIFSAGPSSTQIGPVEGRFFDTPAPPVTPPPGN